MARATKFTDEQRMEIALEILSGKISVAEICRKWDIGNTYAYKLKDRAMELLRNGIGRPVGRASGQVEHLRKKIADLEQLTGDQALVIRYLKKKKDAYDRQGYLFQQDYQRPRIGKDVQRAGSDSGSMDWPGAQEDPQTKTSSRLR